MKQFTVTIAQVYRVERHAKVLVNAEDAASAEELISSGTIDTPAFDAGLWTTGWDLQNEEVSAQPTER